MKSHFEPSRSLFKVLPLVMLGVGLAVPAAHAAAPIAGTPIGNQATATYSDGSDTTRTAQSNTVTTRVSQVPSVDLQQDNNEVRPAGAPVYFPHTLINTGNGPDSFGIQVVESASDQFNLGAKVYLDSNGDGRPDSATPLADLDGDGIPDTPSLAPGEVFKFVVAGSVSNTAASGDKGIVTLNAAGKTGSPVAVDSNTDTVTVTNNAAISVLKKEDKTSGAPGTIITYTLEYNNNGDKPAQDVTLTDNLLAGLSYQTGSGRWSVTGNGTALGDGAGNDDPAGITYSVVGQKLIANIGSVPARTVGRVTFQVKVDAAQIPGLIPNFADFDYDDDGLPGTAKKIGASNTVNFNVDSAPNLTFTGETKTLANQGDTIFFHNIVKNTGNGPDVFDITVQAPGSFPAGTSFKLLKDEGGASLLDTDGDQIPDTGPLAVNATYDVVLAVTLPSNATGNNNGNGFVVTKTATSNATGTPTAIATDKLNAITAASVNLTNNPTLDDGNPATGIPVVTKSGNPGTTQSIILNVTNTSAKPDTFNLGYSTTNNFGTPTAIPAGFTLIFLDSNGNPASDTGNIAAGFTKTFTVQVTIPVGATVQDINLFFRAISPSTGANDIILDRVSVLRNRSISIAPNNSGQVYPNSSVLYAHTVTNTGNATELLIAVGTAGDANGFSSVSYLDANGNGELDGNEANTPLTSIPSLAPGTSVKVITKVFGPVTATATGTTNLTTVTVSLDGDLNAAGYQSGGASDAAQDNTTLVVGDVKLEKFQAIDADGTGPLPTGPFTKSDSNVKPGQYVRYKIVVTNNGGAPVTNVTVSDTTPTYTLYTKGDDSNSPTTGKAVWTIDGTTFVAPQSVVGDLAAGKIVFVIPSLAAGASATITFGVKVVN